MMKRISSWLTDSFDLNNTDILTIRADGTINIASTRISAWSNRACPTLPTLIKALDRTVVEMTQAKKHRATKFVVFLGGEQSSCVFGHTWSGRGLPPKWIEGKDVFNLQSDWCSRYNPT